MSDCTHGDGAHWAGDCGDIADSLDRTMTPEQAARLCNLILDYLATLIPDPTSYRFVADGFQDLE